MNTAWNKIYKNKIKKYSYYDILEPHEDMAWLSTFFKENGAKNILDLGCGAGRNALFLAKEGFSVWGMDNAEEGLLVAKDQAKKEKVKLTVTLGDIYKSLPYAENSFDAIISIQVLQHNKREQIQKTLAEIHRILKPGGFLFITVCGRYSKGKVRYCLVKTADKIAENTYVPTIGDETGLIHFIYNKKLLFSDLANFIKIKFWKDSRDYYCVLAKKRI
ncbi:MAG: hypothetical protein BroJett025_09350 [Patescibacteria group bacterium]|nr:MAG: hypothetical protein BroJett025_09350 [Patescibacteria group bacterium]